MRCVCNRVSVFGYVLAEIDIDYTVPPSDRVDVREL